MIYQTSCWDELVVSKGKKRTRMTQPKSSHPNYPTWTPAQINCLRVNSFVFVSFGCQTFVSFFLAVGLVRFEFRTRDSFVVPKKPRSQSTMHCFLSKNIAASCFHKSQHTLLIVFPSQALLVQKRSCCGISSTIQHLFVFED